MRSVERGTSLIAELHLLRLAVVLQNAGIFAPRNFRSREPLLVSNKTASLIWDVRDHISLGFTIYILLYTVSLNQPFISHGCRDIKL